MINETSKWVASNKKRHWTQKSRAHAFGVKCLVERMKNKLSGILLYLMTAGYFVISMYILVFSGADESLSWFQVFGDAWKTPEYEEVFAIAISSVLVNLLTALMLFIFIGRSKFIDLFLAAAVWFLVGVSWFFTPGLLINYMLGAGLVTILVVPHLTSKGKAT